MNNFLFGEGLDVKMDFLDFSGEKQGSMGSTPITP